ncbi:putative disease resistance protein RGA1 [Vitis vinifera]|uniref:Putative disease resistance protein RGA1 n=1 Tax=Vitis vinifera TaxID=29760 RepID=A0A438GI21_VITVI|nr:putative disease resistance protein RGA1 [Vitis vinifera]
MHKKSSKCTGIQREILKEKECLKSLRLEWAPEDNSDVDDELVMKGLQPRRNLKELYISGNRGERFPSWMMNSLLPNLIKIEIRGCSRCQVLPPFSQLPSLQSLELWNMEVVEGMKEGSSTTNAEYFPALQLLKLNKMPKLKDCGGWVQEQSKITNCPDLTSFKLHSSPRLSTLEFEECPLLSSFELHSSPCLYEFEISDCPTLTSLGLQSSPSLSKLKIHSCPNLTSLEMPSSLGLLNYRSVIAET